MGTVQQPLLKRFPNSRRLFYFQTTAVNQECVTATLTKLLRDKWKPSDGRRGNAADGEEGRSNEFLKTIFSSNAKCNREILSSILEELDNGEKNARKHATTQDDVISVSVNNKHRKEPVVTMTGTDNAKLYCIRDDSSGLIGNEIPNDNKNIIKATLPSKNSVSVISDVQTNIKGEETSNKSTKKPSKVTVKISRLPKAQRQKLHLLESNKAVNIIQYKLDFKNYCKKNPMYNKTSAARPWILMGRISDRMLNDSLLSVAKEMEVNGLLENIYMAEFQC